MTARTLPAAMTRRAVLAGGAMLAAGAAAHAYMPRKAERGAAGVKIDGLLPAQIGDWRFTTRDGVVQTREEKPIEGYDQLVTRVYSAPGLPSVMLLIAYGSTQGGSLQLHRPETCYPGEGFRIHNLADKTLAIDRADPIAAQTFTATRDEREEHLLYWTRISDSFPRTTGEEYAAIIHRVLNGVIPDGVLVRFSAIGSAGAPTLQALAHFAALLVEQAPMALRQVLVGSVRASEVRQTA